LLLSQTRNTVPLKKDKKSQQDCFNGRIITLSGQLGCLLFLCKIGSLLFLSKSLSSFSSLQDGRIRTVENAYKKSQLILYNLSAAYMSGGLMLFFNLNDDTKFDNHVSSICLSLRFGGFLYCYPYVFSL
jgi:hypothetical protein